MFHHLGMQAGLSYQVFLPQECFQSEKIADLTLNCYSLRNPLADVFSLLVKITHSHRDRNTCPASQKELSSLKIHFLEDIPLHNMKHVVC